MRMDGILELMKEEAVGKGAGGCDTWGVMKAGRFGKGVWDGLRRMMWKGKELGGMRQSDGHKRWREPRACIRIPPL